MQTRENRADGTSEGSRGLPQTRQGVDSMWTAVLRSTGIGLRKEQPPPGARTALCQLAPLGQRSTSVHDAEPRGTVNTDIVPALGFQSTGEGVRLPGQLGILPEYFTGIRGQFLQGLHEMQSLPLCRENVCLCTPGKAIGPFLGF